MNLKQSLTHCKGHCEEGSICGGECFKAGWRYAKDFGSEKTPRKPVKKVSVASRAHNTTKGEIICPKCKVPRAHIAYSELENKYRCIYCNTTWAAN